MVWDVCGNVSGSCAAAEDKIGLKWKDEGLDFPYLRFAPRLPLAGLPALGAFGCATGGGTVRWRIDNHNCEEEFFRVKGDGQKACAGDEEAGHIRQKLPQAQTEGEQGGEARAGGTNQTGLCCLG